MTGDHGGKVCRDTHWITVCLMKCHALYMSELAGVKQSVLFDPATKCFGRILVPLAMDDRCRSCSATTNSGKDIFLLPHVRYKPARYIYTRVGMRHIPVFPSSLQHTIQPRNDLSPPTPPDSKGVTQAITTTSPGEDPGATTTHASSESALTVSSPGATSAEAALRMVKDVDGMINRLPAARGSKARTDGELSALEEEVSTWLLSYKARPGSCFAERLTP